MADDVMTASFTCSICGPTTLELPDDYTDADHAKCKQCGADFGSYGDIKKKALKAAKAEIQNQLNDAFKGLKGWTVR